MKRVYLSLLCLITLFSCEEDYIKFLNDLNRPPSLKLINTSGGQVSDLDAELKLPSSIKQDRPEYFTIRANASDPEGQLSDVSASIVSGAGVFSEIVVAAGGSTEFTYTPEPGNLGVHVIKVTATDNLGNKANATLNLEVYINKVPQASFTLSKLAEFSPLEYKLDAKQSIDPDEAAGGGIVALEWTIGGVTFTDTMVNSSGEFVGGLETKYIFPSPGNYTITLVAIDNDGGRSVKTPNETYTIN